MIHTRDKTKTRAKHSTALRGRVTLPMDPRRTSDTVLVFAEPNSPSRRLAEEVGVTYLGGDELFEPLLNGEINPTKVLSTPGMLPSVTQALARFLGPKGLMPTTRRGGVGEGEELVQRIKEAKGSLDWKADERGWVMAVIGRVSIPRFTLGCRSYQLQMHFPLPSIEDNVRAFITSVKQGSASANPSTADEALVSSRKSSKKSEICTHISQYLG